MIELRNVNKTYQAQSSHPLKALKNVNLKFSSTGLVFIHGKSGSGKTSLLSIIGGLDNANSAKIYFDNIELKRFDDALCAKYRHHYIGFVFQAYHLIDKLSVYENVALPLQLAGIQVKHEDVINVLAQVEIEDLYNRRISELSGGQKQRVAIARALIKNPTILLADEPTGNLDSETSTAIFNLLKKFSQNRLVIVVSHDTEYAHEYADRIIELKDGEVIKDTGDQGQDFPVYKAKNKKAKLPFKMMLSFGLGNLFHNKVRILVSATIVSFLVALLTSIYTALYADASMNAGIMLASQQNQIFITEPFSMKNYNQFNPFEIKEDHVINSQVRAKIFNIAKDNNALFFPRTLLETDDHLISISDLGITEISNAEWMIHTNDEMKESILSTALSFTPYTKAISNSDQLIGRLPYEKNEVIISSQLLDLIDNTTDTQTYLESHPLLKIDKLTELKVVGLLEENVSLMPDENIALYSNISLIYTHPEFNTSIDLEKITQNYGIKISEETNLSTLLTQLQGHVNAKILPATDERVNYYTRYQLTLLMGLLVPLMAYIALIFLGYSISNSIAYRRKTIGILRALGVGIAQIQKMFWIETLVLGLMIMGLVVIMVPSMIDVLNFVLKMQFVETHIFYTNYSLFHFGLEHVMEVFFILMALFLVLVFTLTHHINLLDPNEVIRGR